MHLFMLNRMPKSIAELGTIQSTGLKDGYVSE